MAQGGCVSSSTSGTRRLSQAALFLRGCLRFFAELKFAVGQGSANGMIDDRTCVYGFDLPISSSFF